MKDLNQIRMLKSTIAASAAGLILAGGAALFGFPGVAIACGIEAAIVGAAAYFAFMKVF